MRRNIHAISSIVALALTISLIFLHQLRAEEFAPAPDAPDASRTVLEGEDMAAEAAFNREGDIILVTVAALAGAPNGEVVGVELRDNLGDQVIAGDKAAEKPVRFAATKVRKRKSSIRIGVARGIRRHGEPTDEAAVENGGSVTGGVGVDLGNLYNREKGFDVTLSVWSVPATTQALSTPGRWSLAIMRQNKYSMSNTVTMPAPAPPKAGEASKACRSRARQGRETWRTTRTPGSFTVTIIELEGNVTVQRSGSDRWRQARLNQEMEDGYRIQTGLDSRAVVRISVIDAEGEEYEREIFVSPTSQITFTSCLLPRWVFLTGDERRAAMEEERNRPHVDIRFGGISINTTRDVRRTDMRVSTPSCVSGVSG